MIGAAMLQGGARLSRLPLAFSAANSKNNSLNHGEHGEHGMSSTEMACTRVRAGSIVRVALPTQGRGHGGASTDTSSLLVFVFSVFSVIQTFDSSAGSTKTGVTKNRGQSTVFEKAKTGVRVLFSKKCTPRSALSISVRKALWLHHPSLCIISAENPGQRLQLPRRPPRLQGVPPS